MEPGTDAVRVAGVVLAAGRATRMGHNKLLALHAGLPLVAHAVQAAQGAQLRPICVVTGHDRASVRDALRGREVEFAHNPAYAGGLGGSIATGIRALGAGHDAALVLLGDMPRVQSSHLLRLIAALERSDRRAICVPVHGARRGNPVLWPACDFDALAELAGEAGGRSLLAARAERVLEVPMPDPGVLFDVDSPAELAELAGLAPERGV